MCKYCDKSKNFGNDEIFSNNEYEIFIANNIIKILNHETKSSQGIKVNYCPMCGKKFN